MIDESFSAHRCPIVVPLHALGGGMEGGETFLMNDGDRSATTTMLAQR